MTESRSIRAAKRRKERRMEPVQHGMLFGLDAIAAFFRVSRRKVKVWVNGGAPVIRQAATSCEEARIPQGSSSQGPETSKSAGGL